MSTPTRSEAVVWNNLEIEYIGQLSFDYSLDGKDRNTQIQITNIGTQRVDNIYFQVAIEGIGDYPEVTGDGGFAVFPNGGDIDLGPGESFIAQNWLSGIYEDRFNNTPPGTGESRDYNFDFIIATDNQLFQTSNPLSNPATAVRLQQTLSFANNRYESGLTGSQSLTGTINNIASGDTLVVEVATPYSNWYGISPTVDGSTASFNITVPERDDWMVRVLDQGATSQIIHISESGEQFTTTLASTDDTLDFGYEVAFSADSNTGYWRGIVSEEEQSIVLIPGQENWSDEGSDSANITLRESSTIRKYDFTGNLLWEYEPGWECWGGDMSSDGSRVAFLINPSVTNFATPGRQLGVLDGQSGELLWSINGNHTYLEGLECAISEDGSLVASGSTTGAIALFSGDTGTLLWQHDRDTYGQVRNMVFQDEFLYVGTGDNYLYKLNTSDGSMVWRSYIGGWPFVDGLNISPDGELIATGTKSKDTSVIRASDGEVLWSHETGALDSLFSSNGEYVANFYGDIFNATTGEMVGQTNRYGTVNFSTDSQYLIQADRGNITISDLTGNILSEITDSSDTEIDNGEQAQWSYLSSNGETLIVASRDMSTPGERGLTIWQRNDDSPGQSTGADSSTEPADQTAQSTESTSGNANLFTNTPDDQLYSGSDAIDTIMFDTPLATHSFSLNTNSTQISSIITGESDTFTDIERLIFSDSNIALDIDDNAGIAANVIIATFGANNLSVYMSAALDLVDGGTTLEGLCDLVLANNLIENEIGSSTNGSFVDHVYENVVGTAPSSADHDTYTALLDNGTYTKSSLLALAANTTLTENLVTENSVDLIGVAGSADGELLAIQYDLG